MAINSNVAGFMNESSVNLVELLSLQAFFQGRRHLLGEELYFLLWFSSGLSTVQEIGFSELVPRYSGGHPGSFCQDYQDDESPELAGLSLVVNLVPDPVYYLNLTLLLYFSRACYCSTSPTLSFPFLFYLHSGACPAKRDL